jgi:hypothetical protein
MRLRHVATFAAFTAGLTAASALHRRADRRATATPPATTASSSPVLPVPVRDGVVLPFVRPAGTAPVSVEPVSVELVSVEPAAVQPAGPARCGDSGGRTKAGAPCAARATGGGRCHHHPLAA